MSSCQSSDDTLCDKHNYMKMVSKYYMTFRWINTINTLYIYCIYLTDELYVFYKKFFFNISLMKKISNTSKIFVTCVYKNFLSIFFTHVNV